MRDYRVRPATDDVVVAQDLSGNTHQYFKSTPEALALGSLLREYRTDLELSLRLAADWLDIAPVDLSRVELGYCVFDNTDDYLRAVRTWKTKKEQWA